MPSRTGLLYATILHTSATSAQSLKRRMLEIYYETAPSPQNGPPFSANAVRDFSKLPLEVSCIVGSYVFTILVLGFLLLTIGRKMRKQALIGGLSSKSDVVKLGTGAFDTSPTSPPMSDRVWYSPKKSKKRSGGTMGSPGIDSVASFDSKVLEQDKQQRQDELEKLYAAALAHDEILKNDTVVSEVELAYGEDYDAVTGPAPERVQHLRVNTSSASSDQTAVSRRPDPSSPSSPRTPRSPIRAIYPPDLDVPPVPVSSTSPIQAEYPRRVQTPRHIEGRAQHSRGHSSDNGLRISHISSESVLEERGPPRRLRRSPMHINTANARMSHEPSLSGRQTPRVLESGDEPLASARSDSIASTTGTYTSRRRASAARERDWDIGMTLPTPSPMTSRFHENNPYRQSSPTYSPPSIPPTPAQISSPRMLLDGGNVLSPAMPLKSPYAPKTPMTATVQDSNIPSTAGPAASAGTIGSLPLRQTSGNAPLASPGQVQTTYLERRRDMLYPGLRTGMRSAAMVGTPYSPYMPFTPLTPVTPRLATRADRERRRREEGRRAVTQDDAVQEEDEVWGF